MRPQTLSPLSPLHKQKSGRKEAASERQKQPALPLLDMPQLDPIASVALRVASIHSISPKRWHVHRDDPQEEHCHACPEGTTFWRAEAGHTYYYVHKYEQPSLRARHLLEKHSVMQKILPRAARDGKKKDVSNMRLRVACNVLLGSPLFEAGTMGQ